MRHRGRARDWIGWALGALAALTLVLGAPQHVLDLDEDSGPVAEAIVHGRAHTVIDHGQPGHDCAAHCAAHVIGEAPIVFDLKPPARRPALWAPAADQTNRSGPSRAFERPPKA
jgi:hypothetical protein